MKLHLRFPHRSTTLSIYLGILITISMSMKVYGQSSQQIRQLDTTQVSTAIQKICDGHGNGFDHNNYHFVFAFSTSHFGQDAEHGQAMRQAADDIAASTIVPGDSFSVAAWEMNVWNWQGPFPVSETDVATRDAAITAQFPTTHKANSANGHDTENAITEIYNRLGQLPGDLAAHTVLILITPLEASQNSEHERAIGSNNSEYVAAMAHLTRQPAITVKFQEERDGGGNAWVDRQMDFVIVAPKQLNGIPISGTTRSALRHVNPTIQTVPLTQQRAANFPWAPIIVSLSVIAAGFIAWLLFKPPPKPVPKLVQIGDQQFPIVGTVESKPWRLVGPQFPGISSQDAIVGEGTNGFPPIQIGEIKREGKKLTICVFGEQTHLTLNNIKSQEFAIGLGAHYFELSGEYLSNPALPPQFFETHFTVTVE